MQSGLDERHPPLAGPQVGETRPDVGTQLVVELHFRLGIRLQFLSVLGVSFEQKLYRVAVEFLKMPRSIVRQAAGQKTVGDGRGTKTDGACGAYPVIKIGGERDIPVAGIELGPRC